MKIYLAGGQAGWREQLEGHHLLVSFAEARQLKLLSSGWDCPGWVLDSGAFTAWTQGRSVALDAYSHFLDTEAYRLDGAISLDVIPGAPGRLPTTDEVSAATEVSLKNLEILQSRHGDVIWPVFHEGEPMRLLDQLVRTHPKVALGATASRGKAILADWLIPIFDRHPTHRFHGLAMTQFRTLENIPFESVDSTSWLNLARYGLEANLYLLRSRSKAFYRSVGIAAILDAERCKPGTQATRDGQMRIFTANKMAME